MSNIGTELQVFASKYRMFFGSQDLHVLIDACQGDPNLVPVVGMLGVTKVGYGAREFREFAKSMTTRDGLAFALGRDVQLLRRPGHLVTASLSARKKPLAIESARSIYSRALGRRYIETARMEFPYYSIGEVVQLTDVVSDLLQHDASLANPGLQLTEMFIKASQRYK